MKKYSVLFLALCLLGCRSKEEKAQELIKQEMFKTLYDFDSYQPIETKIDSAYYSSFTDSTILSYAYVFVAAMEEVRKATKELGEYMSDIKLYSDSYSDYGQMKYNEAMEDADECSKRGDRYMRIAEEQRDSIISIYKRQRTGQFIGWRATHKFRCKSKGGSPSIGDYIYIFDKDMKRIVYSVDSEDETYIRAKDYILECINDADEELLKH